MSGASGRISDSTSTHIRGLQTESTQVAGRKASAINVDALSVQPVVAGFAETVNIGTTQMGWEYVHH
jgi:hypothetical protein